MSFRVDQTQDGWAVTHSDNPFEHLEPSLGGAMAAVSAMLRADLARRPGERLWSENPEAELAAWGLS